MTKTKRSLIGDFIAELRRRDVIKTCVAYVGVCWVVLQVLDVASQMLIVDVIVGTFMFIFLLCLFPVALYISWHFHFTGRGWERTPDKDLDEDGNPVPVTPAGWGTWLGLGVTLSLCLVIGFQYFHTVKDRQDLEAEGLVKTIKADSIAVLPFVDQSADSDQSFLAIGLAEELTSLLGQTDGFRVAASRSAQVLTDKGLSPVDIGRRLDVQTVLSGSVVNVGNRVKIRVELLDTKNGHTLWTDNFLRELKDIFDLQAEIGRSVVNLLQDKYLETGSLRSLSATSSTDAYVMYLKAREQYRLQTTESMKQARKLFEQALALDPEYAQAYVGLAETIALLGKGPTQYGVLENDIAATLAERNIEKAIVREPNMPKAFAVIGYIALIRDQYDTAISAFDKAIALNPSLAIAYMWKNRALLGLQRFDESLIALKKSIELDPLFQTASYNLGIELTRRGEVEEAESVYKQLQIDYPNSPDSFMGLADIYFSRGDYAGSFKYAYQAHKLTPENLETEFLVVAPLVQMGLPDIIQQITDNPEHQNIVNLLNKDYDVFLANLDFNVATNPEDYWYAFEAGWYHSLIGDKKLAIRLITEHQSLISENEKYSMPWCSPGVEIAWAYAELGQNDKSTIILNKCESLLNEQQNSSITYFELDYLAARIDAIRGDSALAITNLKKAVNNGWREWWTEMDPLLSLIKDTEEFNTQIKFIKDDLAKQRLEALLFLDSIK